MRTTFFAEYFDGITAKRHEVEVAFAEDALVGVRREDGVPLFEWTYEGITRAARPGDNSMRIGHQSGGEAELTLNGHEALDLLRDKTSWRSPVHGVRVRRLGLYGAVGVMTLLLGYVLLDLASVGIAHMVPQDYAREWGEELADEMAVSLSGKDSPYCSTPAGNAALSALLARLHAAENGRPSHFRVRVVDHAMINAFALPGGQVFLLRGLLENARSPEEVFGVLAHEYAHVKERHPMVGVVRDIGLSLIVEGLSGGSGLGQAAGMLAGITHTRSMEGDADTIALDLMRRAKIDPRGMGAFFERLAKQHEGGFAIPAWLSTHPASDARAGLADRAATYPVVPALSHQQWEALRRICR